MGYRKKGTFWLTNLESKAGHNLASCHICGDQRVIHAHKQRGGETWRKEQTALWKFRISASLHQKIDLISHSIRLLNQIDGETGYKDWKIRLHLQTSPYFVFIWAGTHVYIGGSAIRLETLTSTGLVSVSSWSTLPNSSLSSSAWNYEMISADPSIYRKGQ
jgi:hypothetical protein